MRLTLALNMPQNMIRLRRDSWQRWRKQKIANTGSEIRLRKLVKNLEVTDLNEYLKMVNPVPEPYKDLESVPSAPQLFPTPPAQDASHPDWHPEFAKIFSPDNFPIEGVAQAQAFTKSVLRQGLPFQLDEELEKKVDDSQLHRYIKQAFMWDGQVVRKPYLRNLRIPSHGYPREKGILAERSNMILARNFIRFCDMISPQNALDQVLVNNEEFSVGLQREGSSVHFKMNPIITILSKGQLPPPSSKIQEDEIIPSTYPFSPLANFEESNIYKSSDFTTFNSTTFPYVRGTIFSHTIPGSFTHIHPRWTLDRFGGTTILCAFATALLNAKRAFGNELSSTLPSPVTSYTIHTTGQDFQFAMFQLNTLDLDNEESGEKNVVWMTKKMPLFEECRFEVGLENFKGYDPTVFRHFASLLCARS